MVLIKWQRRRQLSDRQGVGRLGEDLACASLTRRGYEIVERNWRCPRGEIDIVARDGECWVFVEVKTRRGHSAGLPEEGLTRRKAERLTELAQVYLHEHALGPVDWRIDLVGIQLDRQGRVERLNVVPCVVTD